jgi:hypothetical protein
LCVVGALVALAAAKPTASGGATRTAPARAAGAGLLVGVNITGLGAGTPLRQADADIAWARRLHAKVVRIDLPWSEMEPEGPGQTDPLALAFLDRLTGDAAAAGIHVIMLVASTPCWASSAPRPLLRRCQSSGAGAASAWPPREPAVYASFVAFLARRYATTLAAIEVWNEPDQINQHYFAGPNKARRYAAILQAAYPAIKQAAPSVPVLAGSLVGSNGVFLRALYAAGIRGYYDGLAVHYYDLTLAALRAIHEVQLQNGDGTPLWLDEFGYSSCWPRYKIQQEQACVTRPLQGTNLAVLVRTVARAPYVAAAVVYKLQGDFSEDFGVLSGSGSRKPAFRSLASAFAAPLDGDTGSVALRLTPTRRGLVARGSAPPGDYMRLEVFQGNLLRFWAVFTLNRFNRYSLLLPAQLGTSGLTVRVYQYWAGPGRAVWQSV